MRSTLALAIAILVATSTAWAVEPPEPHYHDHSGDGALRADLHAPIGVMGDHVHEAGEFMVSYRYGRMRMDGNRDGTDRMKENEILLPGGTYMVSPTDMDMEMHMFGFMYAPTDWLTLMAMVPYVKTEMDHVMANGNRFTTRSEGPGDLKISGLVSLFEHGAHRVHLHAGLGMPTGEFGNKDQVPVPMVGFANRRLPYPMQLGSGTWDLLPGLTYLGMIDELSWGVQALGTLRLGHNSHGYRLGHRADATAWVGLPLFDRVSLSGRAAYAYWSNIDGHDDKLNSNAVPTADPNLRAGHRIDLLGGVNVVVPLGPLGDHRLGVEAGAPVYQWLDGPQLETDWRVMAGWQFAF